MWQAHYYLAQTLIRELEADAGRRRRWQLQDTDNGRPTTVDRTPSRLRAGVARAAASISRVAARFALRLDGRVCLETGTESLLRDA